MRIRLTREAGSLDGIFNVNKPKGLTSHDVVRAVRRLAGGSRVGHAGTLDPMATGVLLICVGRGTRVVEYLMDSRKVYCAEIVLGASTDTYDAEGRVIRTVSEISVSRRQLERALSTFRGKIWQTPPRYSAIKLKGQPLYKLSRAGIEVEPHPRQVEIYRIKLADWKSPVALVAIECSRGTYIRSIANDLGELLGCGAYLRNLVRVASGRFTIEDAVPLQQLEFALAQGYWESLIYPIDEALVEFDAAILGPESERAVLAGQSWTPEVWSAKKWRVKKRGRRPNGGLCRAYSLEGQMVALLKLDEARKTWQPDKVFG